LGQAVPSPSSGQGVVANAPGGGTAAADIVKALLEDAGEENASAQQHIYLGTASRVLPDTLASTDLVDLSTLTRAAIGEKVRDAWNNPVVNGNRGGRPRALAAEGAPAEVVEKLVVAQEPHQSGEIHFQWGVKLFNKLQFISAKRTLRERHQIATHWSCSHSQFWSVLRYLTTPSAKKPVVDKIGDMYVWTASGGALDLYEESQEPFQAKAWKRRREKQELVAAGGQGPAKKGRFTKLDFTAVVIDRGLTTPAAVLEYFQDRGSATMQAFVSQNQKRLKEYLEDAKEWANARQQAAAERESDWDLLCRHAAKVCPCGDACEYAQAVQKIFTRNKHCFNPTALAVALRAVIKNGPSKTARVPCIVGLTNSGKTTMVEGFDPMYGKKNVFHKPALKNRFALRNILEPNKRFLFWDDYRPVEYAQETIAVSTILSLLQGKPLEIAVSQAFRDGNVDFEWRRGALWTAKAKDLWKPYGEVSQEDVDHMKSRVDLFSLEVPVGKLKDIGPCEIHMSRWIFERCAAHDANALVHAPLPGAAVQLPVAGPKVPGLDVLLSAARLPDYVEKGFEEELLDLGAVSISEVTPQDLAQLPLWPQLKVLEQRRLMKAWQEHSGA